MEQALQQSPPKRRRFVGRKPEQTWQFVWAIFSLVFMAEYRRKKMNEWMLPKIFVDSQFPFFRVGKFKKIHPIKITFFFFPEKAIQFFQGRRRDWIRIHLALPSLRGMGTPPDHFSVPVFSPRDSPSEFSLLQKIAYFFSFIFNNFNVFWILESPFLALKTTLL